jgi:co-chaperonin GroES (HSP10)
MIQPILNNVLVKPFVGDEFTGGGLIVPESFRKESDKCTIVAVGNGSKNRPMKLKSGTIGYRVSSWGTPIKENGELFYLMEDNAIIALQ